MIRCKKQWLAVLVVAVCCGGFAGASTAGGATESGPRGVVVNPTTDVIYAITSSKDTVTAIDGASGLRPPRIRTGTIGAVIHDCLPISYRAWL